MSITGRRLTLVGHDSVSTLTCLESKSMQKWCRRDKTVQSRHRRKKRPLLTEMGKEEYRVHIGSTTANAALEYSEYTITSFRDIISHSSDKMISSLFWQIRIGSPPISMDHGRLVFLCKRKRGPLPWIYCSILMTSTAAGQWLPWFPYFTFR